MPSIRDILLNLCELPHRASASENEREAAQRIASWLDAIGIAAHLEKFHAPATFSWELTGIALLMAVGVAPAPYIPIPGTILAVLGVWFFSRHFIGEETPLTKLTPKSDSQNVVGSIHPTAQKKRTIILMAHYDTSRAAFIWSPALVKNFRQSFLINATVAYSTIPFSWLGTEWGGFLWYRILSSILALYFAFQAGVFIHRELFHKPVNGANDNGSGVTTILKLIEYFAQHPPRNSEIIFTATGCEESGMHGAKAFINEHLDTLDPQTTYVLNFDSVGSHDLHYCTGEGMLFFQAYDHNMVNRAARLTEQTAFNNIQSHRYQVAYFDTLPIVKAGYKCLTCIALHEDKTIPNWHWYSDTPDNINWDTVEHTIEFGKAMITEIDRREVVA